LLVPFTHFFFLPRFILGVGLAFLTLLIITVVTLGHKKGDPLPDLPRKIIITWTKHGMKVFMWCFGVFYWEKRRAENADYSKWLGPDWKPSYE